ncbi:MAG: hypothetical protein OEX07_11395, partial [Gammaproteobacteria bacterium]|nr:hypothetical protein [Gammaproteobacteria bacterium]
MHAGFPCLTHDIQQILHLGSSADEVSNIFSGDLANAINKAIPDEIPKALESLGGTVLSNGIALVLKLG